MTNSFNFPLWASSCNLLRNSKVLLLLVALIERLLKHQFATELLFLMYGIIYHFAPELSRDGRPIYFAPERGKNEVHLFSPLDKYGYTIYVRNDDRFDKAFLFALFRCD